MCTCYFIQPAQTLLYIEPVLSQLSDFWLGHCAGLTHSVVSDCDPIDCSPARLLCPCGFSRQESWSGYPYPPPGDSSQPRDQTQVSCIAGRFFTIWATRKSMNTGVGSLSLFQGKILTQESNWSLLHSRWIL